jgi:hypothetical protein
MMLPPWLVGYVSCARSRARRRSASVPLGLMPRPDGASLAGARGYRVGRSHTEGRVTDSMAYSRPGRRRTH